MRLEPVVLLLAVAGCCCCFAFLFFCSDWDLLCKNLDKHLPCDFNCPLGSIKYMGRHKGHNKKAHFKLKFRGKEKVTKQSHRKTRHFTSQPIIFGN